MRTFWPCYGSWKTMTLALSYVHLPFRDLKLTSILLRGYHHPGCYGFNSGYMRSKWDLYMICWLASYMTLSQINILVPRDLPNRIEIVNSTHPLLCWKNIAHNLYWSAALWGINLKPPPTRVEGAKYNWTCQLNHQYDCHQKHDTREKAHEPLH